MDFLLFQLFLSQFLDNLPFYFFRISLLFLFRFLDFFFIIILILFIFIFRNKFLHSLSMQHKAFNFLFQQ